MKRYRVAIVGATGIVGQRFVLLLERHPFFTPVALLASNRSAGKRYAEAVKSKWAMNVPVPLYARDMTVRDAFDLKSLIDAVDFVFCAVDLPKTETKALEEKYAKCEIPVVSCNSANRGETDVPMVIPEVNPEHLEVIPAQKKRLGTKRGFIVAKSNCTLQSYVPPLTPLRAFGLKNIAVCTMQAISGAGKTYGTMPEILDNVIPFINGEEEKTEFEPLKIWGNVERGKILPAGSPLITAQCLRVPVSDGHTAAVAVSFENKPKKEEILALWEGFEGEPQRLKLPSAPKKMIRYFHESDRPQPKRDRGLEHGMAVSVGRLREDSVFDYKFVALSHNTLRGAAGGAILLAELLAVKGYFD